MTLKLGDRWVECDICGFGYRLSVMRKGVCKEQKGYNVCPDCFDPIHDRDKPFKPRKQGKLMEVR